MRWDFQLKEVQRYKGTQIQGIGGTIDTGGFYCKVGEHIGCS